MNFRRIITQPKILLPTVITENRIHIIILVALRISMEWLDPILHLIRAQLGIQTTQITIFFRLHLPNIKRMT